MATSLLLLMSRCLILLFFIPLGRFLRESFQPHFRSARNEYWPDPLPSGHGGHHQRSGRCDCQFNIKHIYSEIRYFREMSQAVISVVDPMKKCFYRQNGFVNLGLFMLINVFKVISMGFLTTGNIFEIFFSVSNAWAWDCSMMGVLGCESCLSGQVTHLIFSCRSFQSNFGRCRTKCGERMFCPG